MATLALGGRISVDVVREELGRLTPAWQSGSGNAGDALLEGLMSPEQIAALDRFDRVQLTDVLAVCRECRTLSEAGRLLFSASRLRRNKLNDADRLRKYLARFGIQWSDIPGAGAGQVLSAGGFGRWAFAPMAIENPGLKTWDIRVDGGRSVGPLWPTWNTEGGIISREAGNVDRPPT